MVLNSYTDNTPYRGAPEKERSGISVHTALVLSTGIGLGAAHRFALKNFDDYGQKTYDFIRKVEDRSPNRMFRTFRLGEVFSSYSNAASEVHYAHKQLVNGGELTDLGKTVHRMGGGKVDVLGAVDGLHFFRTDKANPYLSLQGSDLKIRFTSDGLKGSKMGGVATRFHADLEAVTPRKFAGDRHYDPKLNEVGIRKTDESWWQYRRRRQNPRGSYINSHGVNPEEFTTSFYPTFSKLGTEETGAAGVFNKAKSAYQNLAVVNFEMGERFQHLMAQMGLGLNQGSYNKLAHIPFIGEGGLINKMLTRRVLPAFLIYQGLKYADYKTSHHVSQALASIPLKARVAHAELTDKLPGARSVTDFYKNVVPGGQFGALALPVGGAFLGGMVHYAKVLKGADRASLPKLGEMSWAHNLPKLLHEMPRPAAIGGAIGLALALPFIPGMLGDRKTANERRRIYSGEELVPVRQGRWWEIGPEEFQGGRIKYFRQHWFPGMKAHAEDASLYGNEKEKWAHDPLLHPLNYLKDPYWIEEKHFQDRPYPVTSPAFSNVPLIGPILAATIGKFVKPVRYMHQDEWKPGDDYSLFGKKLDPRNHALGLAAPTPHEEFSSAKHIAHKELHLFADLVGMPGFVGKSIYERLFPNRDLGKEAILEGSRKMTDVSRRYYEKEYGAMAGPNPSGDEFEPYGYSEAIRRFIQPEHELKKVNPLRNEMPSWLPGAEGMQNFHIGDAYSSLPEGYARLPGAGYAALHPEVSGLKPEDYPVLNKFEILADVAPYSKQFSKFRDIVQGLGKDNTQTQIAFERTMAQVKQVKESGIKMKERRFSEKTETISGTIKNANEYGIMLNELPGRRFSYSSIGTGAADLSAIAIGQNNNLTVSGAADEVKNLKKKLRSFVEDKLAPGTAVKLTVAEGVRAHATNARAVVEADGTNINRELIRQGLAVERPDMGSAESRAMYGGVAGLLGKVSEGLAFTGDENRLNPARYLPQPYNSKLWQNRTAISQYEQREMYGTSMRRWHRPIHDFIEPYLRGAARRIAGKRIVPEEVQFHRDVNTLTDTLKYLRGVLKGYTNESRRTSLGANLFAPPELLTSSLSDHEGAYFRSFISETNTVKRKRILEDVSPELSRALTAQWVAKDAEIARADGKTVKTIGEGGRIFTKSGLEDYKKAKTQLDYADYERSKETAEFFARTGFKLPDASSETYSDDIDYQDVKAKIIQQEGYDLHDFNIFDDRASQLWRKPYLDGTARELTSGDNRSTEVLRQAVEKMMIAGQDKSAKVRAVKHSSSKGSATIKVTHDVDQQAAILKDGRRNPDKYKDQAA